MLILHEEGFKRSELCMPRVETHVRELWSKIYADAEIALGHMDPLKLTNDEKFALAVLGGVAFHCVRDGTMWRWQTEPCTVDMYGGKLYVVAKLGWQSEPKVMCFDPKEVRLI